MSATEAPPSGSMDEDDTSQPRFDANASVGAEASAVLLNLAKGDLDAQRYVRDGWSADLGNLDLYGADADLADAGGLFIARMCAAQGDHSDASALAGVLLCVGERLHKLGRDAKGWECIAESFSIFERLGDAGDAAAVNIIKELLAVLPVEAVARAKEYTLKGKNDGTPAAPACIRAVH